MLALTKDCSHNLRIPTRFVCKDKQETETRRAESQPYTQLQTQILARGYQKLLFKSLTLALQQLKYDITSY